MISDGRRGICGVRENSDGHLVLPGYGRITSEALDPIEKKPLYHFFPGETVWSIGFAGCNFSCPFCQNWRISTASPDLGVPMTPQEVVNRAYRHRMIAYTYSEPSIHIEYVTDVAVLARKQGLLNVLVTNGSLNPQPAREVLGLMDAANIDLKSWNSDYYRRTLGGDRDTVLRFITEAVGLCWVEITTLVVPGDNDDEQEFEKMVGWISGISPDIPLHLSAYHPAHRYAKPATPTDSLLRMSQIARERLHFVYVGNVQTRNDTACSACGRILIRRDFTGTVVDLRNGCCPGCATPLPGRYQT